MITPIVYVAMDDESANQPLFQIAREAVQTLQHLATTKPAPDLPQAYAEIDKADVFVLILGNTYGSIPPNQSKSWLELEYDYAYQAGKLCMIFIPRDSIRKADNAQARFINHLRRHHVLNVFDTLEELSAQVKVALGKFQETRPYQRLKDDLAMPEPAEEAGVEPDEFDEESTQVARHLEPPDLNFRETDPPLAPPQPIRVPPFQTSSELPRSAPSPATPPPPDLQPQSAGSGHKWWMFWEKEEESPSAPSSTASSVPTMSSAEFEELVRRAVQVAQGDIEQIVRRSIELHDAQMHMQTQSQLEALDGAIRMNPLWGEPSRLTQFANDIFMIMPFRDPLNSIYNTAIRPAVANLNLTMKRGDDFYSNRGSIINEVWSAIFAARLIIAEITLENANVYYELGIAHTLGKPVILLTQEGDPSKIPFDIRHLRFIVYEDSATGKAKLAEDLHHSIIWILNDMKEITNDKPAG